MSPDIALEWRRFDEMTGSQLYEVLRFRQAVFVVEQGSPYPDLDGRDADAWHLLLHADGDLAGYLRLVASPEAVGIGRVCVAAPLRRRGLGLRLMREALRFAAESHPECDIALNAQLSQAAFYRSLGFETVSTPYDDFGVTHVEMRRRRPTAAPV